MTENEWLTSTDPQSMLAIVRDGGKLSDRKARMFAVACCRRIWPQVIDARSRLAVELAERSADEPVSYEQLDLASGAAEEAYEDSLTDEEGVPVQGDDRRPDAAAAASYASSPGTLGAEHFSVILSGACAASLAGAAHEKAAQSALLRDLIFSRPLSPAIAPACLAWEVGVVRRMALAAYEERPLHDAALDPARLAVLSDAIEEAGCADADVLDHFRSPGPHVRGCWALDLILGKE